MRPTIISTKADNWVDRGEPATPRIVRVLRHLFARDQEADREWLEEHARLIEAMVAAGATEVHVAGYLNSLCRDLQLDPAALPQRRLAATAVWALAKAVLVRDFAERVLQGDVPPNAATPDTLSHWLAQRLLTAEELEEWERDPARNEPQDSA